jgi:hypothetical protein
VVVVVVVVVVLLLLLVVTCWWCWLRPAGRFHRSLCPDVISLPRKGSPSLNCRVLLLLQRALRNPQTEAFLELLGLHYNLDHSAAAPAGGGGAYGGGGSYGGSAGGYGAGSYPGGAGGHPAASGSYGYDCVATPPTGAEAAAAVAAMSESHIL